MYLNNRYRNFILFLITKAQSQTKEQENKTKQQQKTEEYGTGKPSTKKKTAGLTHLLKRRIVQRLQILQAY